VDVKGRRDEGWEEEREWGAVKRRWALIYVPRHRRGNANIAGGTYTGSGEMWERFDHILSMTLQIGRTEPCNPGVHSNCKSTIRLGYGMDKDIAPHIDNTQEMFSQLSTQQVLWTRAGGSQSPNASCSEPLISDPSKKAIVSTRPIVHLEGLVA